MLSIGFLLSSSADAVKASIGSRIWGGRRPWTGPAVPNVITSKHAKKMPSGKLVFGKPLGSLWEASGKPLGSLWEVSRKPLGSFWEASGKSLGSFWEASGKSLGSF